MHIENPDALRDWLTIVLEPLCDADPSALARYVLALLKKVAPEDELQECMQEQLDVFLGEETQPFLVRLREAIKTQEYLLSSTTTTESVTNPAPRDGSPSAAPLYCSPILVVPLAALTKEDAHRTEDNNNETTTVVTTARMESAPTNVHNSSGGHSPIKPPVVVDPIALPVNSGSSVRRSRLSGRSRSRSRSRSPNDRLSRPSRNPRDSRDRLNRPAVNSGNSSYRNKSPPRRFDRRGSGKGGPGADRYNRRNHSRSRSHSPSYRKTSPRSMSPNNHSSSQNTDGETRIQSQVGAQIVGGVQKGKKCRDFEEKGYCMRGETCPWDHGVDPVVLEDINNPTLMNIQQQQHLREYNPDAPDLWSRNASGGGGVGFGPRGGPGGGGGARNGDFHQRLPFRLSSGQLVGGGGGGMMNPGGLSQSNRELIPVPVLMDEQHQQQHQQNMHHHNQMGHGMDGIGSKRRYEDQNQPMVPGMEMPPKRKPLAGRLGVGPRGGMGGGGGGGGGAMGQQNCSLELRKVPRGLNSIAHLNNHFSKFGKIINIQVNYENDPEAAIITFSSHAEANVAYRSTEAVLNNRFIKVFWHTGQSNNGKEGGAEGAKDGEGGGGQQQGPRKPYANQYHLNNVLNKQQQQQQQQQSQSGESGEADPAQTASTNAQGGQANPTTAPTAAVVASPSQLRLKTNRGVAIRRKQEEQAKAAVQMAHGLMKKKHELLQEYLKQMRSCLELMEKVDAMDPQRAKLLQTLKDLQASIDKLRKQIAEEQVQLTTAVQQQNQQYHNNHHNQQQQMNAGVRMTKEQQQKELLDLELELIAQQQEGNDTSHIQRRIQELQRALGRGAPFQRGPMGGAPGGQMRKGTAPQGSTSVDRRPTTIFVAGFAVDDSDALLGHFKHFGEITKNVLDRNIPSLILSFAVRAHAEQAMQRGRIFKEKPLQINWYIPNFVKQRPSTSEEAVEEVKQEAPDVKVEVVAAEDEEGTVTPEEEAGLMAEEEEEEQEGQGIKKEPIDIAVKAEIGELEPDRDDELRLDDEEEDLEDRSWRR